METYIEDFLWSQTVLEFMMCSAKYPNEIWTKTFSIENVLLTLTLSGGSCDELFNWCCLVFTKKFRLSCFSGIISTFYWFSIKISNYFYDFCQNFDCFTIKIWPSFVVFCQNIGFLLFWKRNIDYLLFFSITW